MPLPGGTEGSAWPGGTGPAQTWPRAGSAVREDACSGTLTPNLSSTVPKDLKVVGDSGCHQKKHRRHGCGTPRLWSQHLKGRCHNLLKCLEMGAPRFGRPLPALVTPSTQHGLSRDRFHHLGLQSSTCNSLCMGIKTNLVVLNVKSLAGNFEALSAYPGLTQRLFGRKDSRCRPAWTCAAQRGANAGLGAVRVLVD